MSDAPLCKTCGKPIRKRARTVHLETDQKYCRPADEFSRHVLVEALPKTLKDCERLTNGLVLAVRRGWREPGTISRFSEWDGESYVDEHFCCGTCAREYAYFVIKHAGILPRTKRHADALAALARRRQQCA